MKKKKSVSLKGDNHGDTVAPFPNTIYLVAICSLATKYIWNIIDFQRRLNKNS